MDTPTGGGAEETPLKPMGRGQAWPIGKKAVPWGRGLCWPHPYMDTPRVGGAKGWARPLGVEPKANEQSPS